MNLAGKTNAELVAMMQAIEAKPESRNPPGSLYLYTKKCRKQTDEIARAISSNLMDRRIALGLPINCDGYSGRQTNRRK